LTIRYGAGKTMLAGFVLKRAQLKEKILIALEEKYSGVTFTSELEIDHLVSFSPI